jgi:hypothetical protein
MKLKSFGCSFIFGSDLGDEKVELGFAGCSQKTWPALVAQSLDRKYVCFARPGAGNLQILEQVINESTIENKNTLFVIAWTWIDRYDYYHPDYDGNCWDHLKTLVPTDTCSTAKNYYKDLHSEYRDKLTNLLYVKLAIETLHKQSIPFVMTFMDDLMFETRWNITPAVKSLQDQTRPYMTQFESKTFMQWSRYHGFPESTNWHPLEQAHRAAADYMINVVDIQKIIDPVLQAHV